MCHLPAWRPPVTIGVTSAPLETIWQERRDAGGLAA